MKIKPQPRIIRVQSGCAAYLINKPNIPRLSSQEKALHVAAEVGDVQAMKRSGAKNINCPDPSGDPMGITPLMRASTRGKVEAVKWLIEKGADVNACDISRNGDTKVPNWGGATALHYAIEIVPGETDIAVGASRSVSLDVVELLLRSGSNPNASQGRGYTVLESAIAVHSLECCKMLLEAGSNPNQVFPGAYGALEVAIYAKRLDIIRLLIEYGFDLNLTHVEGGNVLHVAILSEEVDIVEYFIGLGLDLMKANNSGATPLADAVKLGNAKVVSSLMRAGPKALTVKDNDGKFPIDHAIDFEWNEIVELLKCNSAVRGRRK